MGMVRPSATTICFPWGVRFIAHICRIHLSSKGISPCTMCGGRLVCWMATCLWRIIWLICQTSGSILNEKKVLAPIAYISSLRLMSSDPEVSFTTKKRPEARSEQWLHCPWLKQSCCLVRLAASPKAGEFRLRMLKRGDHNTGWQGWRLWVSGSSNWLTRANDFTDIPKCKS